MSDREDPAAAILDDPFCNFLGIEFNSIERDTPRRR